MIESSQNTALDTVLRDGVHLHCKGIILLINKTHIHINLFSSIALIISSIICQGIWNQAMVLVNPPKKMLLSAWQMTAERRFALGWSTNNHGRSLSLNRLIMYSVESLASQTFFFFFQLYFPNGISSMGHLGCCARGKPAATELCYPTYCACWVF